MYVGAATAVSVAVDLAARQRAAAARSGIEAELLARITAEPIGERSLDVLLEHVRDTLHMSSAAVVESLADGDRLVAVAGPPPSATPTLSVPAEGNLRLVVDGPAIIGADPRLLRRLAAAAAPDGPGAAAGRSRRREPGNWPRSTGCGPHCWPRSGMTCAPPWPASRPASPACATPTWP